LRHENERLKHLVINLSLANTTLKRKAAIENEAHTRHDPEQPPLQLFQGRRGTSLALGFRYLAESAMD
jgi:hypothetical protein